MTRLNIPGHIVEHKEHDEVYEPIQVDHYPNSIFLTQMDTGANNEKFEAIVQLSRKQFEELLKGLGYEYSLSRH